MPALAFDVLLNRRKIDTVFHTFTRKDTRAELEDDVKRSLVGHDGYDPAIKVRLETRLTTTDYDVEGEYEQGWELVTGATTRKEARANLRDYRENAPERAYRIKVRHVSIFKAD